MYTIDYKRHHAQSAMLNNAQMVMNRSPAMPGAEKSAERGTPNISPYNPTLMAPQTSLLLSKKPNIRFARSVTTDESRSQKTESIKAEDYDLSENYLDNVYITAVDPKNRQQKSNEEYVPTYHVPTKQLSLRTIRG